jgi:hypothetical protein
MKQLTKFICLSQSYVVAIVFWITSECQRLIDHSKDSSQTNISLLSKSHFTYCTLLAIPFLNFHKKTLHKERNTFLFDIIKFKVTQLLAYNSQWNKTKILMTACVVKEWVCRKTFQLQIIIVFSKPKLLLRHKLQRFLGLVRNWI